MTWPPKLPRDFPLTVTPRGYMKRINGRVTWIAGKVTPEDALKIYHAKALASGGRPIIRANRSGVQAPVTIGDILIDWLADRHRDVERGELSANAWVQYKLSAVRIESVAGHHLTDDWTPDATKSLYDRLCKDFTIDFAKRALSHFRTACRHASESDWCRPIRMGDRIIAKMTYRPAAMMQWKLFSASDIKRILLRLDRMIRVADGRSLPMLTQLRAMVLLSLNGGYGAMELSQLTKAVVDLPGARIDHNRGKTGERHIVPLWPETIEALRPVLNQRPEDDLLFRTRDGNPWCRVEVVMKNGHIDRTNPIDNVNWQFRKVLKRLRLRVPGQGFYKLKHLHATTADRAGDPHATFVLAGHALPGAKGHYVRIDEDRLRKVVDFVRQELIL